MEQQTTQTPSLFWKGFQMAAGAFVFLMLVGVLAAVVYRIASIL